MNHFKTHVGHVQKCTTTYLGLPKLNLLLQDLYFSNLFHIYREDLVGRTMLLIVVAGSFGFVN